MADQKATALSAFTPVLSDILYGVDDPGGTPVSGKVTLTAVRDLLQANLTELTVTDGSQIFKITANGNLQGKGSAYGSLLVGGSNDNNANLYIGGTSSEGVTVRSAGFYAFASGANASHGNRDLVLQRDAADTLALRRGENDQSLNVYSRHGSSTDYHRLGIKTTKVTASAVSGASVTLSSLIPDGAVVVGVTTKVTTGLGTSNGTTGYQVGDGTDADRWGAVTGTASGTTSDNTDWTAGTVECFTSANDVVLTAVGGNFDGTGEIDVSVQYLIGQSD